MENSIYELLTTPVGGSLFVASLIFIFFKTINKKHLVRINEIDKMDGFQFENFVANLLKAGGFCNVEMTNKSRDFGVDIICFHKKTKYVIQVKRYNTKVSNKAIQEIVTGKEFYNADKCAVITNSYFTKQAKSMALKCNVILVDRSSLIEQDVKYLSKVLIS